MILWRAYLSRKCRALGVRKMKQVLDVAEVYKRHGSAVSEEACMRRERKMEGLGVSEPSDKRVQGKPYYPWESGE